MNDSTENGQDQIDAAIAVVKAAFEPDASVTQVAQGKHVLSSLLAALGGTSTARPQPDSATPKGETPPSPATPSSVAPSSPMSLMLGTVIDFLKEQLDDDDRAAIEAQAPPFSIPFINNNIQGI